MEALQPDSDNSIEKVDWGLVFKKLVARAKFQALRAPAIFDGVSVEDVVCDAFCKFFSDKDRLGWNPDLGPLETFLWTRAKSMIIDHLRRGNRDSSVDDETVRFAVEAKRILVTDPRPELDMRELIQHLKSLASGDPELELLVSSAEYADGPNVNQRIAEEMHTTPGTIANLKKRFHRKAKRQSKSGAMEIVSILQQFETLERETDAALGSISVMHERIAAFYAEEVIGTTHPELRVAELARRAEEGYIHRGEPVPSHVSAATRVLQPKVCRVEKEDGGSRITVEPIVSLARFRRFSPRIPFVAVMALAFLILGASLENYRRSEVKPAKTRLAFVGRGSPPIVLSPLQSIFEYSLGANLIPAFSTVETLSAVRTTAINSGGEVVGYFLTTGEASTHAYLFSGGTMTDLGTIGDTNSEAYGINDSGAIVGYGYIDTGTGAQQDGFRMNITSMNFDTGITAVADSGLVISGGNSEGSEIAFDIFHKGVEPFGDSPKNSIVEPVDDPLIISIVLEGTEGALAENNGHGEWYGSWGTVSGDATATLPEPCTMVLLGAGLLSLGIMGFRRKSE